MFWLYLSSLIFGGVFVALSVFSGLGDSDVDVDKDVDFDKDIDFDKDFDFDKDVDFDKDIDFDQDLDFDKEFDIDVDGDIDGDGDVDADKDLEVIRQGRRYRPFLSFKFYTFSMAFFGLTGVVLDMLSDSVFGVLAASIAMGAIAGFGITYLLHVADKGVGGKVMSERDYAGTSAKVVLPVSNGKAGKVKFHLKGRLVEMRAEAYDDQDEFVLDFGEECFVIGVEDGVAKVMHPSQLKKTS